ncbi:hypothetical protein F5Y16DRAFT_30647 [Xylariaceae sp. FL0255]|nr:hypothetical protein F5Y16DRAFT_30647 [Xylariaceae sp. FL0255]
MKFCSVCSKDVPINNFSRHKRRHNGTNKKTCPVCQVPICDNVWERHLKSQSHKDKENQLKEQQNLPTVESFLREFLDTTKGPLMHLSSAYTKEIERNGGLSDLSPGRETEETRIWARLGLRPPILFPAAECWQRKPPVDEYLTDLLHGFSKSTTKVYSRGKPHDPINLPPLHEVLRQLHSPDLSSTKYAINIFAEAVELRVPNRLVGYFPVYQDSDLVTTTNITPKFSAAELHVDHGKHGVTLLHGGCVKLWVLYPLTPHNLERFSTLHRSDTTFIELQGQLEGGELCVQTEHQAIYLPPGCIHGTYTLQGGLTPGIEFSTVECLEPAAKMWDLNSERARLCGNDCYPLLEAVIMGLRSETPARRVEAMEILCPKYKRVCKLSPGILSMVKKQLPMNCSKCGALWGKH